MPQLPAVGTTGWGTALNGFLGVAHDDSSAADGGKLKTDLASIVKGGKVGIGTSTPQTNLHIKSNEVPAVVGGQTSASLVLENNTTGKKPGLIYLSDSDETEDYDEELVITMLGNGDDRSSIFIGPNASNTAPNGRIQMYAKLLEFESQVPVFNRNSFFIRNKNSPVGSQTWGMVVNNVNGAMSFGKSTDTPAGGTLARVPFIMHRNAPNELFYLGNSDSTFASTATLNGGLIYSGTLTQSSDRNLKKDITNISSSLEKISKINGVNYRWKDESKGTDLQLGVITQEVEECYPELIKNNDKGDKTVNYIGLIAPLIESVKELKAIIEAQAKEIADLKEKLAN